MDSSNAPNISPLIAAVQLGNVTAVQGLIDAGELILCCKSDNAPLLVCAVAARIPAILGILLRHAAGISYSRGGFGGEGGEGTCAVSDTDAHALLNFSRNSAMLSHPLLTPAPPNRSSLPPVSSHSILKHLLAQRDSGGNTALLHACAEGQEDMVHMLLAAFTLASAGGDVEWNVLNDAHVCPVQAACSTGGAAVVRALVNWVLAETGRQAGEHTCTAVSSDVWAKCLREAARAHQYEVVDVLLSSGLCGDIDGALPADATGATEAARQVRRTMHGYVSVKQPPLHAVASHSDDARMIKLLLSHKASVDARDVGGATPLMDACLFGHVCAARALLAARADVNACDDGGMTPLMAGIEHGCIVKMLVRRRADVNVTDETGWHSLIWALCDRRASWGDPAWLDHESDEDDGTVDDSGDDEAGYDGDDDGDGDALEQVESVGGVDAHAFAEDDAAPPSGIAREEWERGGASTRVIARLLRARADACLVDVNGVSTLMHAIDNADIATVRLLLRAAALQTMEPVRHQEEEYVNKSL